MDDNPVENGQRPGVEGPVTVSKDAVIRKLQQRIAQITANYELRIAILEAGYERQPEADIPA